MTLLERERWRQDADERFHDRVVELLEMFPLMPVEVCRGLVKAEIDILEGLLFGTPGDETPRGLVGCSPLQTLQARLNTKSLLEP